MARSLNGTSDFIAANAAASYDQQANYAVAFWVRYNNATNALKAAFSEGRTTSTNPFLLLQTQAASANKTLLIVARNNAGGTSQINSVSTGVAVFDGSDHHFVYTHDSSGNFQVYVDGVLRGSGAYTPGATTVDTVTMGAFTTNTTSRFFPGVLWDVAKWSKNLSVGHAESLAAGLPASHLGPTHYWPIWGVDSPEPDIGNG